MQFGQYEAEVKRFLQENYESLKLVPIGNSEKALEELLITEVADLNNYAYGIVQQLVNEVKNSISLEFDNPELGYELGDRLEQQLDVPKFDKIKVNIPQLNTPKSQAAKNFKEKSKFSQSAKLNPVTTSAAAGVGTFVAGTPIVSLLTPLRLGQVVSIIGITAIVATGIVYAVIKFRDKNGRVKSIRIPVEENQPNKIVETLQPLMENLLEMRKAEADLVLMSLIQQAVEIYNSLYSSILLEDKQTVQK